MSKITVIDERTGSSILFGKMSVDSPFMSGSALYVKISEVTITRGTNSTAVNAYRPSIGIFELFNNSDLVEPVNLEIIIKKAVT